MRCFGARSFDGINLRDGRDSAELENFVGIPAVVNDNTAKRIAKISFGRGSQSTIFQDYFADIQHPERSCGGGAPSLRGQAPSKDPNWEGGFATLLSHILHELSACNLGSSILSTTRRVANPLSKFSPHDLASELRDTALFC